MVKKNISDVYTEIIDASKYSDFALVDVKTKKMNNILDGNFRKGKFIRVTVSGWVHADHHSSWDGTSIERSFHADFVSFTVCDEKPTP
jgi:hypothetical protein